MDLQEFLVKVNETEGIEGLGVTEDAFIIKNINEVKFSIPVNTVKESSWNDLIDVIQERRDPSVLRHVSRVVGYFSSLNNWNKSKLAENQSRHRGSYQLS
jgi:hypothetical protein